MTIIIRVVWQITRPESSLSRRWGRKGRVGTMAIVTAKGLQPEKPGEVRSVWFLYEFRSPVKLGVIPSSTTYQPRLALTQVSH